MIWFIAVLFLLAGQPMLSFCLAMIALIVEAE